MPLVVRTPFFEFEFFAELKFPSDVFFLSSSPLPFPSLCSLFPSIHLSLSLSLSLSLRSSLTRRSFSLLVCPTKERDPRRFIAKD